MDRAANRRDEGIHLPTWRPAWGPNSFAPMAASSMKDRETELLIGGATLTEGATLLIDVEAKPLVFI